jgi:dTDP-4-dehydrorhamnose reductase
MRRQNRLPQFQRPLLLVRRGQSPSELAPLKLLTLMEILILGGAGMLGHKLFQRLRTSHPDTACTIRGTVASSALSHIDLFQHGGVIEGMDASDTSALQNLLAQEKPCVVINCIGVVKQRAAAKQPIPSIEINALLPHRLAESCRRIGARLIHFSTDCVFSGRRGNYTEEDISDAEDLYGRAKYLGEVACGGALTLRTSIIGHELARDESLLEWFLSESRLRNATERPLGHHDYEPVHGFTRAIYSGVTTNYLARVVEELVPEHPDLSGLYQVAAQPISKFDLLRLLRDAYRLDIEITPDSSLFCDRSMKGDKFARATGLITPTWSELIDELANDDTPYDKWKQTADQKL